MTEDRSTHKARRRTGKSFHREDSGTAMIEFVVLLPLFVAALAFVFEFGRYFIAYQQTANNVRSAARYISQVVLTPENEVRAENIIRTGRPDGPRSAAPEYMRNLCVADGNIPADCIIRDNGSVPIRIEVRVQFPVTMFNLIGRSGNRLTLPYTVTDDVEPQVRRNR